MKGCVTANRILPVHIRPNIERQQAKLEATLKSKRKVKD